ncbi:MAG: tRNA (adenosine(37)-N6)-threonylcarbamoyltransferase complex dimerization subunit type 1 TsaB [Terriglobia bacterium]
MLVLAIDTTSEHGGAALFCDAECLAQELSRSAEGYSVTLFEMVDRLIAAAGQRGTPIRGLADIDLYGVANGPGSFTGIRVGLAAVQAWSRAFGRPAFGVSVLEAMVDEAHPETNLAVPILDARRSEIYRGVFRRSSAGNNAFVAEGDGEILRPEDLFASLAPLVRSSASITCVAREHDRLAAGLRQSALPPIKWQTISGPLLAAITRQALAAHSSGKTVSPSELDACYIRRTDAELHWKG